MQLLKLVESVLVSYLGGVTEDLMKDHFVTVYSLLDEILGFGMPLAPDLPLLKVRMASTIVTLGLLHWQCYMAVVHFTHDMARSFLLCTGTFGGAKGAAVARRFLLPRAPAVFVSPAAICSRRPLQEIVPPPSVLGKVVDKITGGVGTLSTSSWASAGAPTSAAAAAGAAAAAAAAAAAPVSQFFASAQAAISGETAHHSNPHAHTHSHSLSHTHAHNPTSTSSISSSGFGSNGQGPRTAFGSGTGGSSASSEASSGGPNSLNGASSRGHTVVPWRRVPPRYMHNEITFEFREELDVVVAR